MDYDLAAELHATSLKVHELAAQVQLLVQEERPGKNKSGEGASCLCGLAGPARLKFRNIIIFDSRFAALTYGVQVELDVSGDAGLFVLELEKLVGHQVW